MTDVMPEQLVDLDELTGGETTPANTTGLDAVDEQLIAQLAGRACAGGLQLATVPGDQVGQVHHRGLSGGV